MTVERDLNDMISFLKVHGLWYKFNGRYKSVFQFLQGARLTYLVCVFPLIIASMCQVEFKESLAKYAFLASGGFYVVIKAVSYFLNRKNTEILMSRLANLHKKRTEEWQHEIFYKYAEVIWRFVNYTSLIAIFYTVSYYIVPLIYDLYLLYFAESTEPFSFPFPLEVLGNKERNFYYYTLLSISILWNIFLLSYALGSLAVLWVVVSYCCVDIRILCRLISEFRKNVNNIQKMGKLIDDYRDILELFRVMKKVIGPPLAAQNAVGSLLLTMLLYSAKIQMSDDIILLLINIFSVTAMTTIMFFSCFIGEILQTESTKLSKAFHELPWYKMTPNMRRTLSFLILVSSKPMVIDYKGRLALNLQTFMQVMNSCYSYFMLLNSMN